MAAESLRINNPGKAHGRFYALLSLLLACCFADYTFQLGLPQFVFLGVAFVTIALGDSDEIAALCVCCIPLHTYLEYAFIILFALICHVFKHAGTIRLHRFILPVVAMILWELLHCFTPLLNLMQFGGHTTTWLLLAVFMCTTGYTFDYAFIIRAFVATTTVICCSLLARLLYASGMNLSVLMLSLQRLGIEAEGGTSKINPNSLGLLCIIGVGGLLQLRRAGQQKKIDPVVMLVLLLFGVMTASKTFFICLVFMALLFLFSTRGSTRQKLRYLFNVLLIAAVVLLISYIIMPDLLRYYVSRFFVKDFTTGRLDTMGEYHKYLMDHWDVLLFGIGLQGFSGRILDLCPQAIHVPHNGLQELVLAWGLPGVAIFAALTLAMAIHSRRINPRQSLINYIPLLVVLMKSMAGQMLNSAYTMMLFTLAYLSMRNDFTPADAPQTNAPPIDGVSAAEDGGLDLTRVMALLWKKKHVLAAVPFACAVLAFGVTKVFVAPVYDASVLIYVNNSSLAVNSIENVLTSGDILASRTLVSTYRIILKSQQSLQKVAELSGCRESPEELRHLIRADAESGTEIIRVTVSHTTPRRAQQIANAIAGVLPARISGIIDGTSASVIDYAVLPTVASGPSKAKNALVGFMAGFVLSVMLLLLDAMRRSQINVNDLASLYPYPVLATIPDLVTRDVHPVPGPHSPASRKEGRR